MTDPMDTAREVAARRRDALAQMHDDWPQEAREAVAQAICIALGDDPDREGCRLTAYDAPADFALAALAPWVAEIKAAAKADAFRDAIEIIATADNEDAVSALIARIPEDKQPCPLCGPNRTCGQC